MGSNRSKLKKYNVVDLFCGAGGFSLGLKDTNRFSSILANDNDKDMCKAYSLNFSNTKVLSKCISDINFVDLKRKDAIDVIIGGPPCQAYSLSGKRLKDDPRATLFLEYYRAIDIIRPHVFVYENVKGLFSYQKGIVYNQLQELFQQIGYELSINFVNAVNYGVPQSRERIFIVGYRKGLIYSFPRISQSLKPLTIKDAISDLPIIKSNECSINYFSKPKTNYQKLMRKNAPENLMDHKSSKHNQKFIDMMSYLPEGGLKEDLPYKLRPKSGYANSYGRLWWNKPSTTITRNFGTPSSARCIHPKTDRALTTREGARLQSFPDHFKFYGSRAKRNLQVGNAVPPLLAKQIGKSISKCLDRV